MFLVYCIALLTSEWRVFHNRRRSC